MKCGSFSNLDHPTQRGVTVHSWAVRTKQQAARADGLSHNRLNGRDMQLAYEGLGATKTSTFNRALV